MCKSSLFRKVYLNSSALFWFDSIWTTKKVESKARIQAFSLSYSKWIFNPTPDPLRCSCVLGHCRLAPTVVTVTVVIKSTLIAAIHVAVASE